MKNSIFFSLFLVLVFLSCSEEVLCPPLPIEQGNITNTDEYLIIETIMNEHFDGPNFIHISQGSLLRQLTEKFPKQLKDSEFNFNETDFQEYLEKNSTTSLWGDSFSSSNQLINKDEIDCHFDIEKDGWAGYYKKYENSKGIVHFAKPFINEEGAAFIEFNHNCNWLCGYGYIATLKKEGDNWLIREIHNTWIS